MLVVGSAPKGTYLAEKLWICGGLVRFWWRASSRMLLLVAVEVLLFEEEAALMRRKDGVVLRVVGLEGSLRLVEKLGHWRRCEEAILR